MRQFTAGVLVRDQPSGPNAFPPAWLFEEKLVVLMPTIWIVFGILLLVAGGEALLRGSVGLATLLRLTPAVIGLTVVAAGTSVPELAVSAIAAGQGKNEIAVANVIGSNIFNIAFILGLCAVVWRLTLTGDMIRREYPAMVATSLLCLGIGYDGQIVLWEGLVCLGLYVVFTAWMVRLARRQVTPTDTAEFEAELKELSTGSSQPRIGFSLLLVAAGIGLLAGGAHLTVTGAVDLARLIGWSERTIGLTIVAAGTSLPEVMASLISTVRGRTDVAIANVIGSNIFNILVILGTSSLITPLAVQPVLIQFDGAWMMGVTLLLFPLIFTGSRISRWEGGLLLAAYGAYLWMLLQAPE